jgi:DNA repair protein RadD
MHGKGNDFIVLPTGCHAKGTLILMADMTTKAVEDVVVGDMLMGPDSNGRLVMQLCRGREEMYRITPSQDAEPFVVNANHVLYLEWSGTFWEVTVKDYLDNNDWDKGNYQLATIDGKHYDFAIEAVGIDDFYGFTLDKDHLYVTADRIIHHNSGKSLVIAGIADKLDGPVLVLQPSKEILMQNYHKMRSFGHLPAIFSASAGKKQIAHITFAMIGSVMNRMEEFKHFKHIIVDECHLVGEGPKMSAADKRYIKEQGEDADEVYKPMYHRFLDYLQQQNGVRPKMLGLTATPFRLGTNSFGAQIKFLGRSNPKIWDKMIYCVQIKDIQQRGYLAKMEYFRHKGIDPTMLRFNSAGSDYTDASIRAAFEASDMEAKVVNIIERLMSGEKSPPRKSILVFTKFVEESRNIVKYIPGAEMVSGETPQKERDRILSDFKAGRIPVVSNVGVLTTGFDFPELDTIVLARPTMSLSLYYQMVGRAIRPHPSKKSAWVIDMVNLVNTFGPVEELVVENDHKGLARMCGKLTDKRTGMAYKKQLTNVILAPREQMTSRWG